MTTLNGIKLNYYNNSLNNLHNNKTIDNLGNFNLNNNVEDIYKLKKRISELEETLYIEREEYKEYYKRTRDITLNGINVEKINNYDIINNRLKDYITLYTEVHNNNEILEKKIKLLEEEIDHKNELEDKLKKMKSLEIEKNVYKIKLEESQEENKKLNIELNDLKKYNVDNAIKIKKEMEIIENTVNDLTENINLLTVENIELKAQIENANNFKSNKIITHKTLFDYCAIM